MEAVQLDGWPGDEALKLSGAPRDLRLPFTVSNNSGRPVAVHELSLDDVRLDGAGAALRTGPVPVGLVVGANAAIGVRLKLRLDHNTPPGRYRGDIDLAGVRRPVEIEVAEDTRLGVHPNPVVVDAALGRSQSVAASFENRGNVTLRLDVTGHYPLGEEMPLGTQPVAGEGRSESFRELLEHVQLLTKRPALMERGTIELAMPDGAVELPPGESATLMIGVRLPGSLSPVVRYRAFVPIYAADLNIVVVTAAKPSARGRDRKGGKDE